LGETRNNAVGWSDGRGTNEMNTPHKNVKVTHLELETSFHSIFPFATSTPLHFAAFKNKKLYPLCCLHSFFR
jgi:hypothetical protein